MKTLVLSASEILEATDRSALRQAMVQALRELSCGAAKSFPRQVAAFDSHRVIGFMPALNASVMGYKTVSVFSRNHERGLNPHQGLVVLSDPQSGMIKAILEGSTLTALRTAAVSAAATEILSRENASVLGILGTGRQAFEHALSIAEVRRLRKIVIRGRSRRSELRFSEKLKEHLDCSIEFAEHFREVDILVTATASREVLLDSADFSPGLHLNAIGACRPGEREVEFRANPQLSIFLDSKEACAREASEIYESINSGALDRKHIRGEIGEVFAKKISGRQSLSEITVFKSVGLGIEDVLAAECIFAAAVAREIGTSLGLQGELTR